MKHLLAAVAKRTTNTNDAEKPQGRWLYPTPVWLVAGLLAVECLLSLSNWLGWWHKGYAVLASIVAVGVVLLLMFLWFVIALLFRLQFQFSIRSLLVLVVVVALPCSCLWRRRAERRTRGHRHLPSPY